MKRLFATVLAAGLLLAGADAFAQITVFGGLMDSTLNLNQDGQDPQKQSSTGIYAGATYEFDLPVKGLSVVPGLYFTSTKKQSEDGVSLFGVSQAAKSKYSECTLNLPALARYSFSLNHDSIGYVKFGPTLQLGLSSKTKTEDTGIIESNRLADHYTNGDFKRFDLLLGIELGIEFHNIVLMGGYNHGLLNLAGSNYSSDVRIYRGFAYVGLGYKFDNLFR